ncbi:nucleotidyl transferase AbiEii/AbiGii toxin family protein [Candidatus Micrarchaeota archaeon]|nr:nucleotidyl transferase AbiEii/AbiGii toxin family protein [Candidatus Micrarchaeota archaeon]
MEINLEVSKTIAVQYGLPLQYVIKEFYVFDVLSQIAMSSSQDRNFIFKGGTALNKVFLGIQQRFSEDLDFDLNTESITEVREKCKQIAGKIEGYEILEFRKVGSTIQFYCNYENSIIGKDHVRVDVAAKKIITEKPPIIKPAQSTYTQRFVTGLYVYALEDLVARKMHALKTRTEGKDIYDAYNALPLCGNIKKAIERMLESEKSKESVEEFIGKTIIAVKKQDAKKIRNLTNPFIPFGKRPKDWSQLKNALILRLEDL